MKKFTLFILVFLCVGALFGQGRFSVSFLAGGGISGAETPGYAFLHPKIGLTSTNVEAGYRFWGKLHATTGLQYDSRNYYSLSDDKALSIYQDHKLSMLTVPLGLQFRLPWAYAGAGVHYSMMVSQRQETKPSYINFICMPLPGDEYDMYTYFNRYQTWGYSFELGFTPRLFGGLHAVVEARYAADLSETGFVLPRYRGFSGSVGLLYMFGENLEVE